MVETKTLQELSIEYYKEYSRFIGVMRGSTNLSGLKPVHMRVLYALSTMTNKEHIKAIALLGETIGKYHPHADSGIETAIVSLVKQGFLNKYGNWGSFNRTLENRDHAAFRYISVGWTKFLDYVFENIKYVKFIEAQIEPNYEPVTLPTPIPFALINGEPYNVATLFQGMSHGLSTIYPQFKFNDLVDFIIRNIETNWKARKYPEIFLGDNVVVTSDLTPNQYWNTTNSFKIQISPIIETNPKTREIWIKALTTGRNKKIFSDEFNDALSKKTEIFTDLSTSRETNVYMKFTRKAYYEEYLKIFEEGMVQSVRINTAINDGENIGNISLKQWLQTVYELYKESTILRLNDELKKNKLIKIELQFIDQIRPLVREALQHKKSTEKLIELVKQNNIDIELTKKIVSKYSIKKLLDIKISLDEIDSKINEIQSKLDNIEEYLINKYKEMKETCSYIGTVFVADED